MTVYFFLLLIYSTWRSATSSECQGHLSSLDWGPSLTSAGQILLTSSSPSRRDTSRLVLVICLIIDTAYCKSLGKKILFNTNNRLEISVVTQCIWYSSFVFVVVCVWYQYLSQNTVALLDAWQCGMWLHKSGASVLLNLCVKTYLVLTHQSVVIIMVSELWATGNYLWKRGSSEGTCDAAWRLKATGSSKLWHKAEPSLRASVSRQNLKE